MPLSRVCECLVLRTVEGTPGNVEVLLGRRKEPGFGFGKLVGPGGHIEEGESPEQACVREIKEEVGLEIDEADLRPLGTITFRFPARPHLDMHVTLFSAERFGGELAESAELAPAWYAVDALPFDRMWDDAKYWLPRALAGQDFDALITLAEDCETVAEAAFTPA